MRPIARAAAVSLALFITAVAGAASAEPSAPAPPAATDYAALTARSAALSPPDKARAQALFATGFSLWQSGDFAAAELAFKQGLDIDPANALANYYYGDCLARRKDKTEAKDYLARAAALGGASPEGFKAQAELSALSAAPTNVADMTSRDAQAALVGNWTLIPECQRPSIFHVDTSGEGSLKIAGKWGPSINLRTIAVDGDHVSISEGSSFLSLTSILMMRGSLVTPTRMEGTINSTACRWVATKTP